VLVSVTKKKLSDEELRDEKEKLATGVTAGAAGLVIDGVDDDVDVPRKEFGRESPEESRDKKTVPVGLKPRDMQERDSRAFEGTTKSLA